ncbi:PREDICTED: DNA polymerase alpha catalytic subunit [Dinoponera quadriceps]|uniref:DNA polymerase n=1 Tax=Dinoponera quadriceps TaxID=609295 RepID=A0A6P3X519_DINQU|nr:PREDICTED: DNA polymerase alpha catalytic subunit [Dinoponera quadriceps]
MDDSQPSTSGRNRRQKVDKTGRLSALEKLKETRSGKRKYEVEEIENVYDEVDEKEYSTTVLKRQQDDWIVDDGKSGYVEDGREIFDDDLDEESIQDAKRQKYNMSGPRKKRKEEEKKKGDIQSMIRNMPSKKGINTDYKDDDILGELLSEISTNKKTTDNSKPREMKNKFCHTVHSDLAHKNQSSPVDQEANDKRITQKLEVNSASQIIEDDDTALIFDAPQKKSTNKPIGPNDIRRYQNTNQRIDEDTKLEESQRNANKQAESKDTKTCQNASQMIDDDFAEEELFSKSELSSICSKAEKESNLGPNECVEDLSSIDFDDGIMDGDFSSPVSIVKPQKNGMNVQNATCKTSVKGIKVGNAVDLTEVAPQLVKTKDEVEVFRFYYLDAYENPYKNPGTVYLFGKTYVPSHDTYCSCCVMVHYIPRRIYLLPRKHLKTSKSGEPQLTTMEDVYKEFDEYANKMHIMEFNCKESKKHYSFEKEGTPKTSDYLEVRYNARYPAINADYSGPAIERVFGTTVNPLELLLVERKIKGPGWLDVKNVSSNAGRFTWCQQIVVTSDMDNISLCSEEKAKPPMVIATLNVRMSLNSKLQNEVVMVAVLIHHKYNVDKEPPKPPYDRQFCLVTRPRDIPWPRQVQDMLPRIQNTEIIKCEIESELLEELLTLLQKADPDLIIGYDCAFQFDVLMQRMFALKVPNWNRMGRLKSTTPPLIRGKIILNQAFVGRPICDIQVSAKELNLKVRSYDLVSLCSAVLRTKEHECKEITPAETPSYYNTPDKITSLIHTTLKEAKYIITIVMDLNVIPLALQITCLAGNILSRTLLGGRAERNEYLLLHAFHLKDYITPDKKTEKRRDDNPRKKAAAYTGGLVLDPKKGFYDKLVLLMDFNSLYPSIIQEYNLCFTTVPGAAYADVEDLSIPDSTLETGVVPTEIHKLVKSRQQIKQLMKTPNLTPEQKMDYHIRQMALKLTANSMYGCLGATHCRFYAKGLAALITAKGREILEDTKHLVEKLQYEVIYGDTDSLMINTNILEYDDVFSIGKKIMREVNNRYKKVELDIDGVFRYLLLLQKKKYAAVTMTKLPSGQLQLVQEHKGLDIVRRDWCPLACETGKKILDILLCDQSSDTRLEQVVQILQNVAKSVKEGTAPMSSFVITKQLSKNPEAYPDKKQLSHVMVALRLNKAGGRMWKAGDTLPYIICEDGTNASATERAYHIDEVKNSEKLKVDVNYYLLSQIFPVVLRICEPIEGIDDVFLANNLGLQFVYKPKTIVCEATLNLPLSINDERFDNCVPLTFKCRNERCNSEIIIKDTVTEFHSGRQLSLSMCPNQDCKLPPWRYANAIQNAVQLAMRRAISKYYNGWLECENPLCLNRTRRLPLDFVRKFPNCPLCKDISMSRVYSGTELYNQLYYYHKMFDIGQPVYKHLLSQCPRDMIAVYNTLKEAIDRQLKRNKFSCVDITGIFSSVNVNPRAGIFGNAGSQEDFYELGDLSDDTDKEI